VRWRTEIQIALVIVGVIVWGFGQRTDDVRFQYAGIACFAMATLLRWAKRHEDSERS
jgi:hypothetical protein